jgi:hypothetical protein
MTNPSSPSPINPDGTTSNALNGAPASGSNSALASITAAWAKASNAIRMAIVFGVFLAAYFVVVEPALDHYARVDARADTKELQLREASRGGQALKDASATVGLGVLRSGPVQFPGSPQSVPTEFNRVLASVFDRHGIANRTSTTRTTGLRGNGPLATALPRSDKVERIVQDIQFEAPPDAVYALLADLEREPIVSTVSRLQIRKESGRTATAGAVRVSIAVETWVKNSTQPAATGARP